MGSLTPALSKERELQASRIIISRRGRKEREESSSDACIRVIRAIRVQKKTLAYWNIIMTTPMRNL